jgi:hypothetical protein
VSNDTPLEDATRDARTMFMQTAANPGLALEGRDTYSVAKEWTTLLGMLVHGLTRIGVVPGLKANREIWLTKDHWWRLTAFEEPNGNLHRYLTIDRFGPEDLLRETHQWYVAGDQAATRKPLTLHAISIGRMVDAKLQSLWVRGWRHPGLPNTRVHFAHKDGSALKGWTPVRYVDTMDQEDWLGTLWQEAGAQLVTHVRVEAPSDAQAVATIADMARETARMASLDGADWRALPMHRAACDGFTRCPFAEYVCYNPGLVTIERTLAFERRPQSPTRPPRSLPVVV